MISLTTNALIKTLIINPSFDAVNAVVGQEEFLKNVCDTSSIDPSTFLNYFMPLRMHPKTREAIEHTVKKYKPNSENFYFGLVISEKTIVAIIKNNSKI